MITYILNHLWLFEDKKLQNKKNVSKIYQNSLHNVSVYQFFFVLEIWTLSFRQCNETTTNKKNTTQAQCTHKYYQLHFTLEQKKSRVLIADPGAKLPLYLYIFFIKRKKLFLLLLGLIVNSDRPFSPLCYYNWISKQKCHKWRRKTCIQRSSLDVEPILSLAHSLTLSHSNNMYLRVKTREIIPKTTTKIFKKKKEHSKKV